MPWIPQCGLVSQYLLDRGKGDPGHCKLPRNADKSKVRAEEKAANDIQRRMRRGSTTAEERELVARVELRQVEERHARLWQSMTQAERWQYENPLANPWPEVKGRLGWWGK